MPDGLLLSLILQKMYPNANLGGNTEYSRSARLGYAAYIFYI